MASGWDKQLSKQLGEYLVASELARHERMTVATFAGNVPDFDLLAATEDGATVPIQVKTNRGGHWVFSIEDFVAVTMNGNKQILGKKKVPRIRKLPCVFVFAPSSSEIRFFILEWEQLRRIVISSYRRHLEKHSGERPKKKDSKHCGVSVAQLEAPKCEGKWEVIKGRATK
jgi:hypothetical protein